MEGLSLIHSNINYMKKNEPKMNLKECENRNRQGYAQSGMHDWRLLQLLNQVNGFIIVIFVCMKTDVF